MMDDFFGLYGGYGMPEDDSPPREEFSEELVRQIRNYLGKVWELYQKRVDFRSFACPQFTPLLLYYCFPGRTVVDEEEIRRVGDHLDLCAGCRAGVVQAARLMDRIILYQEAVLERQITSSN